MDVKMYPIAYIKEHTGLIELPVELQQALTKLGYWYDEDMDAFYYSDPSEGRFRTHSKAKRWADYFRYSKAIRGIFLDECKLYNITY